jgi:ketosteroid isomerase-like protein
MILLWQHPFQMICTDIPKRFIRFFILFVSIDTLLTVRGWGVPSSFSAKFKYQYNYILNQDHYSCGSQYSCAKIQLLECRNSKLYSKNHEGENRIDGDSRDFHNSKHHPTEKESNEDDVGSINKRNRNRTNVAKNNKLSDKDELTIKQQEIESVVRKKIRVARAQAEIDRILTGPDAPCDLEREWAKVTSIAAINSDNGSSTFVGNINTSAGDETITNLDDKHFSLSSTTVEVANSTHHLHHQQLLTETACQELELDLHRAVKVNDFDSAMQSKDALDRLQMDHGNAVLQLNSAFYKAFSSKDYKAMAALWIPDSTATCILPTYKKPLIGNRAVLRNWQELFESKNVNAAFQRSWIEPSNMHISTIGSSSMVIVTCHENVYVRRFIRGEKRKTVHVNTLQATNIFRKVAGIWYLQYHHASPMSSLGEATNVDGSHTSGNPINNSQRRSIIYDRNMFDEPDDSDGANKGNGSIGMDAILGIKNLNADIGSTDKQQQSSSQPKQIIMGGLSDLLNGNLGNLLSGTGNENKGGNIGNNEKGFAIIRVSRVNNEDDDDFDDDEEEDDDDEFDDDLEDLQMEFDNPGKIEKHKNDKSISIIKHWADAESENIQKQRDEEGTLERNAEIESQSKDDMMRQQCISSLRRLTQQGLLSPSHKRVLLTDIITSAVSSKNDDDTRSSKAPSGKKSLVQVAYELLLGPAMSSRNNEESNDIYEEWRNIAEEEFAEQCRLFAEELM